MKKEVGKVGKADVFESLKSGAIAALVLELLAQYGPQIGELILGGAISFTASGNPMVAAIVVLVCRLLLSLVEDYGAVIPGVKIAVSKANEYLRYVGLNVVDVLKRFTEKKKS